MLEEKLQNLLERLFPICRSITGEGLRETLNILTEISEFDIHSMPSGKSVFDWKIPKEWNLVRAYIEYEDGDTIIDTDINNLHVVNYSIPVDKILTFEELSEKIFYLKGQPDAIPYRTSYYKSDWGFCISYNDFLKIDKTKKFRVVIDSSLYDGELNFGEYLVKGKTSEEILVTTYCCHPSMANDNLSGVVNWIYLLKWLKEQKNLNYSYRFAIFPETIGAITYLSYLKEKVGNISAGIVLTTCGGSGPFHVKKSFKGNSQIDKALKIAMSEVDYIEHDFDINGSDERQFSSPGFRIPCVTISKDKYYEYDYYHTSLDNLDFVNGQHLEKSLSLYRKLITVLDYGVAKYENVVKYGEVMLSPRGLYPSSGGHQNTKSETYNQQDALDTLNWILFDSDGESNLIDIVTSRNLNFDLAFEAVEKCLKAGVLVKK